MCLVWAVECPGVVGDQDLDTSKMRKMREVAKVKTSLADISAVENEIKRGSILKIPLDTNGMTNQCPARWYRVSLEECQECSNYVDCNRFIVYCNWRPIYG